MSLSHHEQSGRSLAYRLRMPYLVHQFGARYVWAVFVFINSFVTMAILALLAHLSGTALIFPSLGPTAILFFLEPRSEPAKPRNALLGHAIGIGCGYLALVITGLTVAPSVFSVGVTVPRVLAASLALALTGSIMVITRVSHPPAGATTLLIALGLITQPRSLLIIELAVALLVLQAMLINWLAASDETGLK